VSDAAQRTVVTVRIAGEEYAIRTEASPDYTRECAAFVDGMLKEILDAGLLQAHKAPVLVALAITDRLFQARKQAASASEEFAASCTRLTEAIEREFSASSLATPS
jgi:cell division protein ZapA (FtsZ GTPase activity inhibitor)